MSTLFDHKSNPVQSLLFLFLTYKAFILAIAVGTSIASDYDTSTDLFFNHLYGSDVSIPTLAQRLTRWDALYYMHNARVGRVFEQEWAFGDGMPGLVSGLVQILGLGGGDVWEPMIAISIAHYSHFGGVVALYKTTELISGDVSLSFISAVLHIISPAGLFLSAPYSESPFSCLSFVGNYVFALALNHQRGSLGRSRFIILSGVLYGVATVFRTNGLSSGLLFAAEAIGSVFAFVQKPRVSNVVATAAAVLGGLSVAAGTVLPQALAWKRYCGAEVAEEMMRPWCSEMIPNIYGFVQEKYWNVGFLNYWTPNQIPLFLLAAPVLSLLILSGYKTILDPTTIFLGGSSSQHSVFVRVLAGTQTFVALLAITNYHVQIINRLASGYIVWYWWIAACLLDERRSGVGYGIVMFMVMYGGIQGGLFASFLPPA